MNLKTQFNHRGTENTEEKQSQCYQAVSPSGERQYANKSIQHGLSLCLCVSVVRDLG